MNENFCQSCGMPMNDGDALYGTEKGGAKSADYCKYCYEDGAFFFHGNMDEMIEICVAPMVEQNPGMTQETAREMMRKFLPMLKRWQTK